MSYIDIEPQFRALAAIDDIEIDARQWSNRRPRRITARDAISAGAFEAQIVAVAACNVAGGMLLSEEDKQRLLVAANYLTRLADEAGA